MIDKGMCVRRQICLIRGNGDKMNVDVAVMMGQSPTVETVLYTYSPESPDIYTWRLSPISSYVSPQVPQNKHDVDHNLIVQAY